MTKSTFDPTVYHFVEVDHYNDELSIWETKATSAGTIGSYRIVYTHENDKWDLFEIMYHNDNPKDVNIYYGRIPDDEFAFQLFKNMELELPIIQREIKIESIYRK